MPEPRVARSIEAYFATHDRVCTPGTVSHRLEKIGERAGFEKTVSGTNLRMTFGKMLAEKGFSSDVIRQVMGFRDNHQGKTMTQRYFILSDEHENPIYHCGEETDSGSPCGREVFFPDQTCYLYDQE